MEIVSTGFQGLVIIKPTIHYDSRGYFFVSYNQYDLRESGIAFEPVQDNESWSTRGVIRGLHYQLNPWAQSKLVRVIEGKIFDVALDIRRTSPSFGKWFGLELDSVSKYQLLIPKGFAHGFSVLSDTAIIAYKCDNFYNPDYERGISARDKALNIDWKLEQEEILISDKDLKHPVMKLAEMNF
jgi:dTDP-4-dehydrorhamnose 3,5-epimerase